MTFFIFHPYPEKWSNLMSIVFKWVETTNSPWFASSRGLQGCSPEEVYDDPSLSLVKIPGTWWVFHPIYEWLAINWINGCFTKHPFKMWLFRVPGLGFVEVVPHHDEILAPDKTAGSKPILFENHPHILNVTLVPGFLVSPTYMGVSENSGTPKSSILIGFSIINHPFWGISIFGNIHIT